MVKKEFHCPHCGQERFAHITRDCTRLLCPHCRRTFYVIEYRSYITSTKPKPKGGNCGNDDTGREIGA